MAPSNEECARMYAFGNIGLALQSGCPPPETMTSDIEAVWTNQDFTAKVATSTLGDFRFMENILIPVDLAMAIAVLKMVKDGKWDVLKDLYKTRDDNTRQMIVALAQAGSSNLISAWANSHLIGMMLEHEYRIRKGGATGLIEGLNALVISQSAMNWFTAIFGKEGLSFPQIVMFDQGQKVVETKGLSALAAMLRKP
jgi:hypothetical protein